MSIYVNVCKNLVKSLIYNIELHSADETQHVDWLSATGSDESPEINGSGKKKVSVPDGANDFLNHQLHSGGTAALQAIPGLQKAPYSVQPWMKEPL